MEVFRIESTGEMVESSLSDSEVAQALRAAPPSTFGSSLLDTWIRYGRWSEQQRAWAHKLVRDNANRQTAPKPEATFQPAYGNARERVETLLLPKLRAWLDGLQSQAQVKLVHEMTRSEFVLRRGKIGTRSEGRWVIKMRSKPLNVYKGAIMADGSFRPDMNSRTLQFDLKDVLLAAEQDPLQAAVNYGRVTGSCSFCSHLLTDQRSVSVGYGPICAERNGLPWGDVVSDLLADVAPAE